MHRLATAACGVALLVMACQQSDPGEQSSASVKNDDEAAHGTRNACDVLTAADLQRYAAGPLVAVPGTKSPYETTCEYRGSDWVAGFTVVWRDGRSLFESYNAGIDIAAKIMSEPGVNVDSIVRPGPVAGLGDAAMFSDLMPSYVLVGDRLLELQIMLIPNSRAAFVPLARKAIARLE